MPGSAGGAAPSQAIPHISFPENGREKSALAVSSDSAGSRTSYWTRISLGISGNTCVYLISCQNGRTKALLVSDLWEFQTWKGHGHRRERPEKEARLKDEARVGGQNRVLFLKPVGRRSTRSVKQTPAGSFLFPPETGAGRWE